MLLLRRLLIVWAVVAAVMFPAQRVAAATLSLTVPAAITIATARVLAQNLLGADIDENGQIVFGAADQDLAPTMRLRRDFWVVEIGLMVFCMIVGRGNSTIAIWARIMRLVVVLLGVCLTFWTVATLLPQLAATTS